MFLSLAVGLGLGWVESSTQYFIDARVGVGTGIFFFFLRVRFQERATDQDQVMSKRPLEQSFDVKNHLHERRSPQGGDSPSDELRLDRDAVNCSNCESGRKSGTPTDRNLSGLCSVGFWLENYQRQAN